MSSTWPNDFHRLAGSTLGKGLQDFLTDRNKLTNTALAVTGIALGVSVARVSTGVAGRYVEARLGKPSLIRETTRVSVLNAFRFPWQTLKAYSNPARGENAVQEMVLEESLEARLRRVAVSTVNTKNNKAPYR